MHVIAEAAGEKLVVFFFANFRVSTTNTGSTPVSCGVTEITDQVYSQTGHRIKRSYSNSMGLAQVGRFGERRTHRPSFSPPIGA